MLARGDGSGNVGSCRHFLLQRGGDTREGRGGEKEERRKKKWKWRRKRKRSEGEREGEVIGEGL